MQQATQFPSSLVPPFALATKCSTDASAFGSGLRQKKHCPPCENRSRSRCVVIQGGLENCCDSPEKHITLSHMKIEQEREILTTVHCLAYTSPVQKPTLLAGRTWRFFLPSGPWFRPKKLHPSHASRESPYLSDGRVLLGCYQAGACC